MRIRLASLAIALAAAHAAAPTAAAIYTDQARFLAANSNTALVSFSGLTPNLTALGSTFVIDGLTISAPRLFAVDTHFWGSLDSLLGNNFGGSIILSFVPTTRFGLFLANGYHAGLTPTIAFRSGMATIFSDTPVAGGVRDSFRYYGVDGIGSFDSVKITAGGPGAFVSIADVSFGTVPEPTSWMLLVAGMGLTGAAMRRSHRQRHAAHT